jgi:uncharacterized protein with HEPN domain
MRHEDAIRVQHMLEAAEDALSFTRDHVRPDLDADRQLALAVDFDILWLTATEELPRLLPPLRAALLAAPDSR